METFLKDMEGEMAKMGQAAGLPAGRGRNEL